ncbi:MAG TPA: IPT/TIG domain-containing protein [Bryobacteraceae bacterium]|nr:IPT/TIG domain-containing protein [Bryobacteraceae bacterium]
MKTTQTSLFRLAVLLPALVCSIDTARAQNNSLTAYPPQLLFNGASAPSQPLQLTSSGAPVNFTVSVFSDTNWLQVSPTSGITPATLSVSIGSAAPPATDVGFINISAAGSFLSVPVQFNPNSSGGISPLSTNPNSLSFNFAANSTLPVTQTVQVSSSSSGITSFTATPVTSNGGTWLTVTPASGNLPDTLLVTVNPAGLQAGTFASAIAINAPGSNGISLPVQVTIAGTAAINVSPGQLSFGYQIGTSQPLAQTLSVTSTTGANVSFTASATTSTCGGNWLVLSPQSGATPSTLSVQVNTSSLSAGTCTGVITISAPGASNPSVTVQVNLLVSINPLLQVPTTGPTFTYQIGSSTLPAAQNVQITSTTAGVNFTASASPASGSPAFLQVSPASGTTTQALALSLNQSVLATLGPGIYTETVSITASGAGNSPQTFPVTLVVNSNPILTANAPSLNFNYQIGQTVPSPQAITISSTGAPLNYSVAANASSCAGFLAAALSSGSTFSPPPQVLNQVVVSVNTTGLTPGVCSGNVTLSVPGSSTPPLLIPVTLNVSNTALLNVGLPSINVTDLVGAAATIQAVSVSSTDPNNQLPFTAVATTNPVGLTWLSVTPNSGNTPNQLQVTINPINLGPGTYTGSITVSSTATNVPAQTIPVTLIVASSTAIASPTSVAFSQTVSGPQPTAQTVQISGVPAGITIGEQTTMLNGSGWLTASISGNVVTINANGSQLPQGAYQGVVTVFVPGAANSPIYIPVTLSVGPAPAITVTPSSVTFNYAFGSTQLPAPQVVQVNSTGSVTFNATFTPSASIANRGNFITVTPASGTAPAAITLGVNPAILATLSQGTYTGTVTISSPGVASQTVSVTLTIGAAPPPAITAIVNAATLQPGAIAPGEIISIFGTNFGPLLPQTFTLTSAGTVPTTLGGVTVMFNNVSAPVLYVSSTQINAIVPYETAGQTSVSAEVQFGGLTSAMLQANVVATEPGIFSLSQGGSGQGAILNQDYSVNGANNPAAKGSVIQIFATGEGQLVPPVATGSVTPGAPPFSKPVATVTVTIGGQTAQIEYAGEAPTLVAGVIQINAVIPAGAASGNQPVVVTIGTNTNSNQTITVAVQ